mmetsp:Transcript_25263/g.32130  ORF Transcript_25263/g.32130 Transcript_25263/m.32130 type:complete len:428 (-) Transcript_25263:61-1344(-)
MKVSVLFSLLCVLLAFLCCVNAETERQRHIVAFTEWLDDNNIQRNFDLVEMPGQGVGGIANKDLSDEDFLLKVPESKMIYNKDHMSINGWDKWSGLVGGEQLMLWVLTEKLNENSDWKHYLNLLPSSYEEHLLMWNEEDFKYADMTGLYAHQQSVLNSLKQSYEHLQQTLVVDQPDLFPEGYFTFQRYVWSYLVVSTRAWSIAQRDGDRALVPLADMLNHVAGSGQGGTVSDEFVINSTRNYAAGEQVYDSYGPKTNFELLTTYGFIPENNPHDGAGVELALHPEQNLVHSIVEPLLRNVDPNYGEKVIVRKNQMPLALLRVFRLSVLKFSELDMVDDILKSKAVSLKNERLAFHEASNALRQLVAKYPSEEEELALLAKDDLNYKQKSAIRLRLENQRVFKNAISTLQTLWKNILIDGHLLNDVSI